MFIWLPFVQNGTDISGAQLKNLKKDMFIKFLGRKIAVSLLVDLPISPIYYINLASNKCL